MLIVKVQSSCFAKHSLGNHELDDGVAGLTPFIRNLSSPVLAANLILDNVPELQNEPNLYKSIILKIEDRNIGVIGYLTPNTKFMVSKNEVEYEDEIIAIKREIDLLKKQGVNIFIALGHSGYMRDMDIAKYTDDIDLVIGGHSHTFLGETTNETEIPLGTYPTIVTQPSGRKVPVVQAYAFTKYMGKLYLTFDSNGEITKWDGLPLLLDHNIQNDPEVLNSVDQYRIEIDNINNQVLGQSLVLLNGSCRLVECNMGNLITDAILEYASNYHPEYSVNIAIIHGGTIRTSIDNPIKPFNITKGDLTTVLPFMDTIVIVTMNGTVLKQALEHSVDKWNRIDSSGQFLQMAGIKVSYDLSQPVGFRVVEAQSICFSCDKPETADIKDHYEYKVYIPTFIVNGGDGYTMFENLPHEKVSFDVNTCVIDYLNKHNPVKPEISNRILILNEAKNIRKPLLTNKSDRMLANFSFQISLGNHELDEGVAGLTPFIRNLSVPVLAANLILDDIPELENEPNLLKSIILQVRDYNIGIIGYLTPETIFLTPKNKVKYEDEITAIRREVKQLKAKGVHILIALGHSGYIKDKEIARNVEDIDLVIGGHSNTFLWNGQFTDEKPEVPEGPYPTMVSQPSGRKVPVVQAYAYTKYLGKLHLTFNSKGEIVKYDGLPLLLDHEVPNDPDLLNTVEHYQNEINKINNEVLGESLVVLNGDCRITECNIGNLFTDSILEYTARYYPEYSDVKIAVVQGGRIRNSIDHPNKPMKITRGDLITVLPFSDTLTIVAMNGTILKKALERSVATWRRIDKTGQFLQMAGMKVTYDLSEPTGSRVVKAQAICSHCGDPELRDIKDDTEYKLLMPTFLADGGDNYSMFENLSKEMVSYDELKSTIDYISRHNPVKPEVSNRIILLNEDKIIDESSNTNKSIRLFISLSIQIISFVLLFIR